MKRRNFLLSLFGLAAAPAVAKLDLLLPAPVTVGVDMAHGPDAMAYTVFDLRAAHRRALDAWFAEKIDQVTFEALTKDV